MTSLHELDFKRWKDRREAQNHIFMAWQCTVMSVAIPMLIHVIIKVFIFTP